MATVTVYMSEWILSMAKDAYATSKQPPPGLLDNSAAKVSAVTFAAFAIEAALNYAGSCVTDCWEAYETLRPNAKAMLVYELAHKPPPNFGSPPWQSFKPLFRVRNDIAHAKHRPDVDTATRSSWETACDGNNLERLMLDAESIVRRLHTDLVPSHMQGVTMQIASSDSGRATDEVSDIRMHTGGETGHTGSDAATGPTGPTDAGPTR